MATLHEICELVWSQLSPNGKDEAAIKKEQVIARGRYEYAYQFWLKWKAEKREEGMYEVPSYLLTEQEFDVVENEIDMAGVEIMRGLEQQDQWLQNIGGIQCSCSYVKSTVNLAQIFCDDDSLADDQRIYFVLGKKIKFPLGVHKKRLPVIFANMGERVDGEIEIDEVIGGVISRTLLELYLGKIAPEDKTNNSNPNT